MFLNPVQLQASCERSGKHCTSTALTWTTACSIHAGHGRIALDSPQHYTGEVTLDGQASLQVEGQRYAACTGPAD